MNEDMLSAIKEQYLGKLNDALIDQYRNAVKHDTKNVAEWIDEFTKKNTSFDEDFPARPVQEWIDETLKRKALDELFSGTPQ
jgi:hypothetical protein